MREKKKTIIRQRVSLHILLTRVALRSSILALKPSTPLRDEGER